jgi:hypothetical protein
MRLDMHKEISNIISNEFNISREDMEKSIETVIQSKVTERLNKVLRSGKFEKLINDTIEIEVGKYLRYQSLTSKDNMIGKALRSILNEKFYFDVKKVK